MHGSRARGSAGAPVDVLAADETFLAAAPAVVAGLVKDPAVPASCWPDLQLQVSRDRGDKGLQWVVAGAATGTAEVWLEPWHDGTIVHLYLRLRAVPGRGGTVRPSGSGRQLAWKRWLTGAKDELDEQRRPGCPPTSR